MLLLMRSTWLSPSTWTGFETAGSFGCLLNPQPTRRRVERAGACSGDEQFETIQELYCNGKKVLENSVVFKVCDLEDRCKFLDLLNG